MSEKIIPAQRVQMMDPNAAPTHRDHLPSIVGDTDEPKITLIKEGDTVKAIEIRCVCGEVIRLDCEY